MVCIVKELTEKNFFLLYHLNLTASRLMMMT